MFKFAFAVAEKDLMLIFRAGAILVQAVLLGLSLIFLFSLSKDVGEVATPREVAVIFWLSSVFCEILLFNQLYALEEATVARQGLILSLFPTQAIWLGKAVAAGALLLTCQLILLPAAIIFLNADLKGPVLPGLSGFVLCDIGICALGSLLGAIGQGQNGREALLSVIFFPLLLPLLFAGVALSAIALGENGDNPGLWLGIAGAFDAIFLGASLLLFNFIYQGDN